ncbi:hypothetical protein CKF54_03715 [Psittacicella hinzii]|uniref:Uncharacterized protein n=1 Tax=Psittacicella hinzii TaxID=2028575 RepID=A0A3A1Y6L5_9GAMM|nr:hypothetical protein [Psittacicella hinzii]RIY32919.1 hypothetical protein CKF54_03715 [Psittacicella hinzii]
MYKHNWKYLDRDLKALAKDLLNDIKQRNVEALAICFHNNLESLERVRYGHKLNLEDFTTMQFGVNDLLYSYIAIFVMQGYDKKMGLEEFQKRQTKINMLIGNLPLLFSTDRHIYGIRDKELKLILEDVLNEFILFIRTDLKKVVGNFKLEFKDCFNNKISGKDLQTLACFYTANPTNEEYPTIDPYHFI